MCKFTAKSSMCWPIILHPSLSLSLSPLCVSLSLSLSLSVHVSAEMLSWHPQNVPYPGHLDTGFTSTACTLPPYSPPHPTPPSSLARPLRDQREKWGGEGEHQIFRRKFPPIYLDMLTYLPLLGVYVCVGAGQCVCVCVCVCVCMCICVCVSVCHECCPEEEIHVGPCVRGKKESRKTVRVYVCVYVQFKLSLGLKWVANCFVTVTAYIYLHGRGVRLHGQV